MHTRATDSRTVAMTPDSYASDLLRELGIDVPPDPSADTPDDLQLWADSGAQYLTGAPDGPPLPCPAPLASCALGTWRALASLGRGSLDASFPAHQLLGERAALQGLQRQGAISAGGDCRLLDCADGQLALNLPRQDDWQLLPAWLETSAGDWVDVTRALRDRACAPLVSRGRLLGLAVAESAAPRPSTDWFAAQRLAAAATRQHRSPLVIDLSALWAGPLCTQLLAQMGARVIKLESVSRPDGARRGLPGFFDLLNAGKQSVALDLASAQGRRQLRALLGYADIVVESTRPRGLEQMGIDATEIVRRGDGCVWLSITGYGRAAPLRDWIAYGDDAGVAAGLSWLLRDAGGAAVFCADAVADPLTGLHSALLAWAAWTRGGGVLLDVALRGVVSRCIAAGHGAPWPRPTADRHTIAAPRARPRAGPAVSLGDDTTAVLSEYRIRA